jgi:hypothetical protein
MSATRAPGGRREGPQRAAASACDGRPAFNESARQYRGEVKGGIA